MFTLFGFICLGYLVVIAYQSVKRELSPKRRKQHKEVQKLIKETDELLGRN